MDIEPGKTNKSMIQPPPTRTLTNLRTLQFQSPSTWWQIWMKVGHWGYSEPQLGQASYERSTDLRDNKTNVHLVRRHVIKEEPQTIEYRVVTCFVKINLKMQMYSVCGYYWEWLTRQYIRIVLIEARDCGNALDRAGTDGEGFQCLTHGSRINHTHLGERYGMNKTCTVPFLNKIEYSTATKSLHMYCTLLSVRLCPRPLHHTPQWIHVWMCGKYM